MSALTSAPELVHAPWPMSAYGKNPFGENMYRCVWAPSRRRIVYGQWPDGSVKSDWTPKYPAVGERFILEKWLPVEKFAGCTREAWERQNSLLGPYPDRGDYEIIFTFDAEAPTDGALRTVIAAAEFGSKITMAENRSFLKQQYEDEEAAKYNELCDRIRSRLPFMGSQAISGRVSRGTKNFKPMRRRPLPARPRNVVQVTAGGKGKRSVA